MLLRAGVKTKRTAMKRRLRRKRRARLQTAQQSMRIQKLLRLTGCGRPWGSSHCGSDLEGVIVNVDGLS